MLLAVDRLAVRVSEHDTAIDDARKWPAPETQIMFAK
jgi:hypothetical protein